MLFSFFSQAANVVTLLTVDFDLSSLLRIGILDSLLYKGLEYIAVRRSIDGGIE